MTKFPIEEGPDGSASIYFDASIYPLNAVKKAAYKFAKDCAIVVNCQDGSYRAEIAFFDGSISDSAKARLIGAFCNEVIDQDLREQIAVETEAVRNLILAQAFSKTSLLNND